MGAIEKIRDRADDYVEYLAMQTRVKYYDRWMEKSEADTIEGIDYTDPYISLEWKLCDPRNLALISKGKHRDRFLEKCTEDERHIYLTEGYTDLEKPHVMRSIKQAFKDRAKRGR